MRRSSADDAAKRPSWPVLAAAFLIIWLPYVAGVGAQEGFGVDGALGPALVLLSLLLAWPVSRWLASSAGRAPFGLDWRRSTLLVIVAGIALMALARVAAGWLAVGSGMAAYDFAPALPDLLAAFAITLAIGAVPALAEDILTRGFPLFAARSTAPALALIALSAAIYTANHIWRFDWGASEQLRLFCMGLAYAGAAYQLRSLWAAFALHLGWNAGSALVPLDILQVDAFRLLTAALHLLLAVPLLLVRRRHS